MSMKNNILLGTSGRNQYGITEDDQDGMRIEFERRQALSKEDRDAEDIVTKKEIAKKKKEQKDKLKAIEAKKEQEYLAGLEKTNKKFRELGFPELKPIDPHFSMSHPEYLQSKLWSKIRRRVLKRDSGICQLCNKKANAVHHRSYAYEVIIGECDNELISLCNRCHDKVEFDKNKKHRSVEEKEAYLLQQLKASNK